MPVWNFAFGSHLSKQQLSNIIGQAPKQFMRAILPDYCLTFWKLFDFPKTFSNLATGGSPALVPHKGSQVYGAVYLISEEQLAVLDKYEAEWGYERIQLQVKTEGGRSLLAYAHNRVKPGEFLPPAEDFLKLMITGLQEHGYPPEVVQGVRRAALTQL